MFPLESHTIFLTLAGSQAHGTSGEGSDVDVRGVCVTPLPVRLSLFRSFDHFEGLLPESLIEKARPCLERHPTAARALGTKIEGAILDVAKFVGQCAAGNPNALEILFADDRDWLFATPAWHCLYAERHRFLTQKVRQTFGGYALAQLKRIRTHRAWLLDPPAQKPSRENFGLPISEATLSRDDQNRIEQSIAEKLASYGIAEIDMPKHTRIALQERLDAFCRDVLSASEEELEAHMRAVATHALQLPPDVVGALNAEKKYRAAMKHWEAYQTWKAHRNPARAALEHQHGYDTKHAMHLIRLMRMCREVLENGELHVRRADAEELKAVRAGVLSYEELIAAAQDLQTAIEAAAASTRLPVDVDLAAVDELLLAVLMQG